MLAMLMSLACAAAPFIPSSDVVAATLSPDASFLVTFHRDQTAAEKWSFPEGKPLGKIELSCTHGNWVNPAISPDGTSLAYLCGGRRDGTLRIVDLRPGSARPEIRVRLKSMLAKAMRGLLWSGDGIGVLREKRFDLFSPAGKLVRSVTEPHTQDDFRFGAHAGKWALAGTLMHVPDDERTNRFDAPNAPYRNSDEEGVRVMDANGKTIWSKRKQIGPVAFSLDGKKLLMARSQTLTEVDLGTGQTRTGTARFGTKCGLAPRVGGYWVLSCGGKLQRFGHDLKPVGAPIQIEDSWSPTADGKLLVAVMRSGENRLFVWDAAGAAVTAAK